MVSRDAGDQIVRVLVTELGVGKSVRLVGRLRKEVKGNQSYRTTLKVVAKQLKDMEDEMKEAQLK